MSMRYCARTSDPINTYTTSSSPSTSSERRHNDTRGDSHTREPAAGHASATAAVPEWPHVVRLVGDCTAFAADGCVLPGRAVGRDQPTPEYCGPIQRRAFLRAFDAD